MRPTTTLIDFEPTSSTRFHPTQNQAGTRTLRPTVYIESIQNIDTQTETFDSVLSIHVSWLDCWPKQFEDLSAEVNRATITHEHGDIIDPANFREMVQKGQIMDPRIEVRNLISAKSEESMLWYKIFPCKAWEDPKDPTYKLAEREGCVIVRAQRISGRFKCWFHLRKFPLDSQYLTVKLISYQKVEKAVFERRKIDNYTSKLDKSNFFPKNEWILEGDITLRMSRPTDPSVSMTRCVYSQMKIQVKVSRKGSHFTLNVLFPMFLITLLSHGAGFIPLEAIGDKINIIFTMFLAAIAFKIVAAQELPKIGYLNLSDILMNLNLLWLFGLTVFELAAFESDMSKSSEEAVVGILAVVWLALGTGLAIYITHKDQNATATANTTPPKP